MERRRKYLIDRKLQFGFVNAILAPLLVSSAAVYYLIYAFVSWNMMIIPENVIENFLPPLRRVNVILLIFAPVLIFLLIRWAIWASNRIAGPIYRLKKDLDRLAAGDLSVRFKFRKDDHFFHPVAEKLNMVLDRVSADN